MKCWCKHWLEQKLCHDTTIMNNFITVPPPPQLTTAPTPLVTTTTKTNKDLDNQSDISRKKYVHC